MGGGLEISIEQQAQRRADTATDTPPDTAGSVDRSDPVVATDEVPRPAGSLERVSWGWRDVVWCLVLVALACGVTVLGVVRATSLSALDEVTHLDYTWRVAGGELPAAGDPIAPEVLDEWSCRGQSPSVVTLPPCGAAAPAEVYPASGENYNYWSTPVYYGVTAAAAGAVDALPIGTTFTTSARLTGALWSAAALVGMYLVLRLWRTQRSTAAAAAAVLLAVPAVAHATSTVTSDAPGALAGVLALWVLTRVFVQGRSGWVLPALLAALVTATKVMHAVALLSVAGVVLLVVLGALLRRDLARARALVGVPIGIVGATVAVHAGWGRFQAGRGDPGWENPVEGANTQPVSGSPLDEWLPTLFDSFGITSTFVVQDVLSSSVLIASAGLLSLLFAAAPLVNVSALAPGDPRRMVGWAALAGCAGVPLLVQGQAYLMFEDAFPAVAERYGISLLALVVAALALVAQHRGWRVAPAVVAALTVAALVLSFAGAFPPPG